MQGNQGPSGHQALIFGSSYASAIAVVIIDELINVVYPASFFEPVNCRSKILSN